MINKRGAVFIIAVIAFIVFMVSPLQGKIKQLYLERVCTEETIGRISEIHRSDNKDEVYKIITYDYNGENYSIVAACEGISKETDSVGDVEQVFYNPNKPSQGCVRVETKKGISYFPLILLGIVAFVIIKVKNGEMTLGRKQKFDGLDDDEDLDFGDD